MRHVYGRPSTVNKATAHAAPTTGNKILDALATYGLAAKDRYGPTVNILARKYGTSSSAPASAVVMNLASPCPGWLLGSVTNTFSPWG